MTENIPNKNSATAQAARDELFEEVFHGRMTPQDAEAEAARQGLEPLRREPDISRFDPMAEATWTLAMTVAWIVWRTPEAVRENWNAYRCQCRNWTRTRSRVPIEGRSALRWTGGWLLEPRGFASLTGLSLAEAFDDATELESRKHVSVKTAREELWDRLATNALAAAAIQETSGHPVQIPAHEWAYLTHTANGHLADELRYSRSLKVQYHDVTFSRADVCRLWPTLRGQDTSAAPHIEFEEGQESFTLYEATVWVGCEGRSLPSEAIAYDGLLEKGENELFPALFKGSLAATGLNRSTAVRERIPREMWERARHAEMHEERTHRIEFLDETQNANGGFGGTLTPFGEASARWVDIQIDGNDLRAAFDSRETQPERISGLIAHATDVLWGGSPPANILKKQRDAQIQEWCKNNGHRSPSERSLRKYFNVSQ